MRHGKAPADMFAVAPHADDKPSLSVSEGDGGRILLNCHAGCSFESVIAALGISAADLAPPVVNRGRPLTFTIAATYDYHDATGKLVFQVCRMEPKSFRQRRPQASAVDGFIWNLKGVGQVPYRLPELIAAVKGGQTVFIAEGEKDVETLVRHGFAATCNACGAGKWRNEFGEFFDGAKSVVVIADKDAPGRAHAAEVAAKLKPLARSVKVIELPDNEARPVKDAADFFAAGGKADALRALAADAPDYVPKSEVTPATWFKQRFPKLSDKHGEPVHEFTSGKRAQVRDVSEDFMAATLGVEGSPEMPTIFLPIEERFYTYNAATGILERQREEDIAARLSALFLDCARACRDCADTSKLEFRMRDTAALSGIVKRAKSLLAVREDFFTQEQKDFIPVANGMLRLSDRALLPFAPSFRCRHKLAVEYKEGAYCPRFLDTLLKPALDMSDVSLIQRWSGLALLGVNLSQKMLLLTGTPGGGKSTLVSVLTGIIGNGNVGMLRTELLSDRFELGRLIDKTLLYGADVRENFLTQDTASRLKSLTGGDFVTAEFKNSNEAPQLKCKFNVIVTSNSRLTVYLEGDADAWRRRLVIVNYEKQKPLIPIPDLAERIVSEEGSGVLNFMLDGLDTLRAANWQLSLNERQQRRVDDLCSNPIRTGYSSTNA
jgi:P4 family phage/plasmid primase-like protien